MDRTSVKEVATPPTAQELGLGQGRELPPKQRVDSSNWTLAPYNRWSFQRVQRLTRTARVARSPTPMPLPVAPKSLGSMEFADHRGEATRIETMLRKTWTDGFLVMHRGEVLTEQYFNGMAPDTLHLIMSCSKSMTATAAAIFIDAGLLDPTAPLTDYVPELRGSGMDGATLQQALDMRVGVRFSEDYDDLDADWRQCELATGWRQRPEGYTGPADMLSYLESLRESVGPHGGLFHYQSILTNVLGLCLERAADCPFVDLFAERIWQPMGAEHDLVSIVDSNGTAVFEGGFNCCLRDFARFGQLICNGGTVGERQLIPTNWIDDCRFPEPELLEAFSRSEYGDVDALAGQAYHNQWWVRDPARGVIMAIGIHGQMLFIDPEKQLVVTKFSSQPAPVDLSLFVDQMLGFEAIGDQLNA